MGTAQDMLDLLDGGDAGKLEQLEQKVAEHLGFSHVFTSVGQVYPRSLDTMCSPRSSRSAAVRRRWPTRSG